MRVEIYIAGELAFTGAFTEWPELVECVSKYAALRGGASLVVQARGAAQIEGVRPPAEVVEDRE